MGRLLPSLRQRPPPNRHRRSQRLLPLVPKRCPPHRLPHPPRKNPHRPTQPHRPRLLPIPPQHLRRRNRPHLPQTSPQRLQPHHRRVQPRPPLPRTRPLRRSTPTLPRPLPPSQIRLWLYEDTTSPNFLREVLDFLQVDPTFTPDTSKRHLEANIPKSIRVTQSLRRSGLWGTLRAATPPAIRTHLHSLIYRKQGTLQLQPPEREILTNYYRADILKLQTLLQPRPLPLAPNPPITLVILSAAKNPRISLLLLLFCSFICHPAGICGCRRSCLFSPTKTAANLQGPHPEPA